MKAIHRYELSLVQPRRGQGGGDAQEDQEEPLQVAGGSGRRAGGRGRPGGGGSGRTAGGRRRQAGEGETSSRSRRFKWEGCSSGGGGGLYRVLQG